MIVIEGIQKCALLQVQCKCVGLSAFCEGVDVDMIVRAEEGWVKVVEGDS